VSIWVEISCRPINTNLNHNTDQHLSALFLSEKPDDPAHGRLDPAAGGLRMSPADVGQFVADIFCGEH